MERCTVSRRSRFVKTFARAGMIAVAALALQVTAEGKLSPAALQNVTRSPVYWNWDPSNAVGSSQLVRTNAGLGCTYHTSSLPAGQVVTVWIVVFNNPGACATSPCSPADIGNPLVGATFSTAAVT